LGFAAHEDDWQLYIDPDSCIDCEACVPECPVEAIFHEGNVPSQWTHFVELNAVRVAELKLVGGKSTEKKEAKVGAGCRGR
jgi:ferredoxin